VSKSPDDMADSKKQQPAQLRPNVLEKQVQLIKSNYPDLDLSTESEDETPPTTTTRKISVNFIHPID
jgi:hypothetical protein